MTECNVIRFMKQRDNRMQRNLMTVDGDIGGKIIRVLNSDRIQDSVKFTNR